MKQNEQAARRKKIAADAKRMQVADVAAKWSVSTVMVRRACKEFGVTPKPTGRRPGSMHERDQKIAEFCREHTVAAAIEEFGVTSSVIVKACRDHDVSPMPRQRRNLRTLVIVRKLLDRFAANADQEIAFLADLRDIDV